MNIFLIDTTSVNSYLNNNNQKRKINPQKYINDGIIDQILSIDDKKKIANDDIKKENQINIKNDQITLLL